MTLHAEQEMAADDLSIFDVEHAIFTGRMVGRAKDSTTHEWKYLLRGNGFSHVEIVVVLKLSRLRLPVIITVYRLK